MSIHFRFGTGITVSGTGCSPPEIVSDGSAGEAEGFGGSVEGEGVAAIPQDGAPPGVKRRRSEPVAAHAWRRGNRRP